MQLFETIARFDATDRLIAVGLVALAAVGCGNNSTAPPTPAGLALFSGGSQTAVVNAVLPAAVAVKVTDHNGVPVSGVVVTFTPNAGSGAVSVAQATSDANGLAQVQWTLGTKATVDSLTASVDALTTLIVATATSGPPSSVLPVAGSGQSAAAGSTLSVQLSVIVLDAYGNAVPNVTVVWTDNAGGSFNGNTTLTNAAGVSVATYTLGPSAGTNDVFASAGSGSATRFATFTEQAM